jgi:alkylation response protein AidB-like acyl-CoA dehydrogenase
MAAARGIQEETAPWASRGGAALLLPVGSRRVFAPEYFTEDQRSFFRTGHEFTQEQVIPEADFIDKDKVNGMKKLRELMRKAGELGLLSVDVAEEYGGLGADKVTSCLVSEAVSSYGGWSVTFGAHVGIGTLPIVFFGNAEQKAKYLPKLASGELIAAYALSESSSGSDALGAKTKATLSPDGKSWILNGSKQWITNAGFADVFIVFAKIDGEKFTGFIVDRDTPGFSTGAEEHKMGIRGSSTRPLIFEDAKIPVGNLLGEPGKGHRIAFNILNFGRLKLGFGVCGGSKHSLERGVVYAKDRKAFGKCIADFGLIREKFARATAYIYALDSMNYRTAGMVDDVLRSADKSAPDYHLVAMHALEEYAIESSIMKVFGSESFAFIVSEMLQVHGGYGYVEEYPIERAYRDERVNRIFEGTNEINRMLIPGMLFKRAMKAEVPLMAFADQIDAELADPKLLPAPKGPLASEVLQTELAKRQFVYAARAAAMKFGLEIDSHQEVLAALADAAMNVYAMDSTIARTLQVDGGVSDPVRVACAQWMINECREVVFRRSRDVLANAFAGEELQAPLASLSALYRYVPYDTAALREKIVPSVLEKGGYPYAY